MRNLLLVVALTIPFGAFAAGSGDSSPPKPTETTKKCKVSKIWDNKKRRCVTIKDTRLDDDTLYQAARELAYVGRYGDAIDTLKKMSDQQESRVLTYYGFAHRKAGRTTIGTDFYLAAINADPDNILARSYMGQGMVEQGDMEGARVQLAEIRHRGGTSSWAETALASAIHDGKTFSY